MKNLIPFAVFHRVLDVTPDWISSIPGGVRGVVCDLDNTLAAYGEKNPSPALSAWIRSLKAAGLSVLILSNNRGGRVRSFAEALDVPYIRGARKPFREGFLKSAEALELEPPRIVVIGDQIFTDVYGANRCGMKSVIVGHDAVYSNPLFRLRRFIELPFIRMGRLRPQSAQLPEKNDRSG